MKAFILMGLLLILCKNLLGQAACIVTLKIESPVIAKPVDAAVISSDCSMLFIKWKGNPDQLYIVNASYRDAATNQLIPAQPATGMHCDNEQNCTATIPVKASTSVSWSVQAMRTIEGRTFYSYPVRSHQDYIVPACIQPPVTTKEAASTLKSTDEAALVTASEKLTITNEKFAMYPNPANSEISVNWKSEYQGNMTLTIVDVSGKTIKTISLKKQQPDYRSSINVRSLKPGLYFLNIITQHGTSMTAKFLKTGN